MKRTIEAERMMDLNNNSYTCAESGLYHYRARAYSPDLGRFLQQDPAGMVDGPNLYAYCGNEPVGRRDPGGMRIFRVTYGGYGFRPFSSALYDHVVACMIERFPYASVGSISALVGACIFTTAVVLATPLTISGLAVCAAISYTAGFGGHFMDCVYISWGPAERDCGFRRYSFHWYMTPTGYSGYVPV